MQYNNFGKFIHNKREALVPKPSLNAFAIENGLEPATLSRIENCKQSIKLTDVAKIANGFGITASELIKEFESLACYHGSKTSF